LVSTRTSVLGSAARDGVRNKSICHPRRYAPTLEDGDGHATILPQHAFLMALDRRRGTRAASLKRHDRVIDGVRHGAEAGPEHDADSRAVIVEHTHPPSSSRPKEPAAARRSWSCAASLPGGGWTGTSAPANSARLAVEPPHGGQYSTRSAVTATAGDRVSPGRPSHHRRGFRAWPGDKPRSRRSQRQ